MGRWRIAKISAVSALALLLASACGSGGSGSGGSNQTAGKSSAIVIGNIGTNSGPESTSTATALPVLANWVKTVNAAGGIKGHQVKLISYDDALNPATALQDAKKLVEDHVVAIVGEQSLLDSAWASIPAAAGVPVIGGMPFEAPFATNADFFGVGTNYAAQAYAELYEAKQHFGNSFAYLYCAEAPICATSAKLYTGFAQSLGMKVFIQSVSASAPNYTALCQQIKSSGVESYTIAQSAQITERIVDDCHSQGVTAKLIETGGISSGSAWVKDPAAQGMINVENDFPIFVKSTAAVKAAYNQAVGSQTSANPSYSYIAAKLFQAAVEAIPSGQPITAQSLTNALYSMKNQTLSGLTEPLTFTKGKPSQIDCWFVSGIQNSQRTTPQGLTTTCGSPSVIAAGIRQTS